MELINFRNTFHDKVPMFWFFIAGIAQLIDGVSLLISFGSFELRLHRRAIYKICRIRLIREGGIDTVKGSESSGTKRNEPLVVLLAPKNVKESIYLIFTAVTEILDGLIKTISFGIIDSSLTFFSVKELSKIKNP